MFPDRVQYQDNPVQRTKFRLRPSGQSRNMSARPLSALPLAAIPSHWVLASMMIALPKVHRLQFCRMIPRKLVTEQAEIPKP